MRKINQKEYDELIFKPRKGFGKTRPFNLAIGALEINERLLILKEEWPIKTPPHAIVWNQFSRVESKHKKFSVQQLKDGTGWVITRLKDREQKL